MKKIKIEDPERIIKKITEPPTLAKMALGFSIVSLIIFIVGLFLLPNDKEMGIVLIISGLSISILTFLIYFFKKMNSKNRMKDVDFDKIRKELIEGVVEDKPYKTYFTKNYMLSNYYYSFVIEYKDIVWTYKRVVYDFAGNIQSIDLAICLNNGKKLYAYYQEAYIDEIVKHNNKVLIGDTKENKEKYKEIIKEINNS